MPYDSDVIIVGAGPTGLMVAGEVARAGISTMLIERRDEESNLTRAFAVQPRTLEIFDARGLADQLIAEGQRIDGLRLFGHIDLRMSKLPSRFPYVLVTPQFRTERALLARAESAGVHVVRGAEVVSLNQDDMGVDVDVRTREGAIHTRRARYVVGADGVHSTVRRQVGLSFPGHPAVVKWLVLADVRLAETPPETLVVDTDGIDFAFIAPFGDGWYRVFAWNRDMPDPAGTTIDLSIVQDIARRALGTDYGMHDPRWLSRFHNDERQVPHYRVGRVFVAGDAAHVHSPAGGQGMNTGLQDAANLGWKLAAVLRDHAPESLLDSYNSERHPVGRRVVRTTSLLLRAVVVRPALLRAARTIVGEVAMHIPPIAERWAETISGIGVRYSADSANGELAGARAPDLPLVGGGRLYEALRTSWFVLVTDARDQAAASDRAALWGSRVTVVGAAPDARQPRPPMLLIRPDGYVAWSGARSDASLIEALTVWCGARDVIGRPSIRARSAPRVPSLRPRRRSGPESDLGRT